MAPSITITQVKSIISGAAPYQVATTAIAHEEATIEVFCYVQTTDAYSHPATMYDVLNYPTVSTPGIGFYRTSTSTLSFATPSATDAAAATIVERVDELVEEYRLNGQLYSGVGVTEILSGYGV